MKDSLILNACVNNNTIAFVDTNGKLMHLYDSAINLNKPLHKKLITQAHQIFVKTQKELPLNNKYKSQEILIFSRAYRAIIKSIILDIQEQLANEVTANDYIKQLENLNEIEFIWNLLEILFLDNAYNDFIIIPLIQWITWHFTEPSLILNEIVTKHNNFEELPNFWNMIYSLTFQGQIDIIYDVLKTLNVIKENSLFDVIISHLDQCPMLKIVNNHSPLNFQFAWETWGKECNELLSALKNFQGTESPQIKEGLINILRIVIGQDSIFSELKHLCEPWYALFISKLFYQYPSIKTAELPIYLKKFLQKCNLPLLSLIDEIIQSTFKFDILNVLTDICLYFENWWFPAHLADLLARTVDLTVFHVKTQYDIREYIMLEFVSSISNHPTLWSLVPSYLDTCPVLGNSHLQTYLEKIPLTTETKAMKIFTLCQKRGYMSKATSICRQMAKRYVRDRQYGSAINWALKMDDYTMADFIVIKLLNEGNFLENHGDDLAASILDVADKTPLLAFLAKYRELELCEISTDNIYRESLLMTIITSPFPSLKFAFIFLELLDSHIINFPIQTTDSIYEIMRWLDETFYSDQKNEYSVEQNKLLSQVQKKLRKHLALANLTFNQRISLPFDSMIT